MINGKVDMSEWKECKLGDVAEIQNGYAFKSSVLKKEYGIPIIKIKNVASGKLQLSDIDYYQSSIDKLEKFIIKNNDILIAMTGSHVNQPSSMVGKVARYDLNSLALMNQRVGKIYSVNHSNLDEDFLFYFFKQQDVTYELALNAGGSANQANISPKLIKSLAILLPPLSEQRAIASVLSSLDDKIDLLHRQNKTLEALAETLFRKCFESKELKMNSGKFGNVVQFIKGKKPNSAVEVFMEGLVPQILIETFDTGKTLFSEPDNMVIANQKDILMVMDGASSGRVEIGFTGVVGSTIGLFKPIDDFNFPLFLFYFIKSNEDTIKENTTGSAIPHTDKTLVLDLEFEYSSIEEIKEFEQIVDTFFQKKTTNIKQIRTLEKLRDTLLPKLMSGEVRVVEGSDGSDRSDGSDWSDGSDRSDRRKNE